MSKLPSERINEIYVEMAKEKGLNPSSAKANPLINLAIIMYLDETAKEKECEHSRNNFKVIGGKKYCLDCEEEFS
jgi:hypothetical protein